MILKILPKSYTAIDITTEVIEATKRLEIKKLNMENVKIINADAENLPIKDEFWILFGVVSNTSFS